MKPAWTSPKIVASVLPIDDIAAINPTVMRVASNAYSIAVAPFSLRANAFR